MQRLMVVVLERRNRGDVCSGEPRKAVDGPIDFESVGKIRGAGR